MVSTRRQINNEKDRFGGYAQPAQTHADFFLNAETDEVDFPVRRTFIKAESLKPVNPVQPEIQAPEPVQYSGYPGTAEYIGNKAYIPSSPPSKKRAIKDREEIMPSIKTRRYIEPEMEVEPQPKASAKPRSRSKVDAKTKSMLIIYVIAAVILAIAVLATGIAIGSVTAEVTSLEQGNAVKQELLNNKTAVLASLENEDSIAYEAMQNGMYVAGSAEKITLIPLVDEVVIAPRTNPFENFCQWLSGIFS